MNATGRRKRANLPAAPNPWNQPLSEGPMCPAERAMPGSTPNGSRKKTDRNAKRARMTMMITRTIVFPLFGLVTVTSY
jgi:hypothetical protein